MVNKMITIKYRGVDVLSTAQLVKLYQTTDMIIYQNFRRNLKRYEEGKHYFKLEGEEFQRFKASLEAGNDLRKASSLYLWTLEGALLHAKSLTGDNAWDIYKNLINAFFDFKKVAEQNWVEIKDPVCNKLKGLK